ncbi:MAG: hypothetical protein JNL12_15590 [Planctomycetes bacterium]|nr:hypothetical protein [Planctomycetota bacterium]
MSSHPTLLGIASRRSAARRRELPFRTLCLPTAAALLAMLAACGGRRSDPVPPAGPTGALHLTFHGVTTSGDDSRPLVMGGAGDRRQVAAWSVAADRTRSAVTTAVELQLDDATVARLDGDVLESVGPGETTLRASYAGSTVAVLVRVVEDAAAAIEDFSLSVAEPLRLHATGAVVDLTAMGSLGNGARVAVDSRLQWSSSTPSTFLVDSAGRVTAVGEGTGLLSVRDAASGRERTLAVAVALPRPSGSTLPFHQGGLVVNGNLSAYVPPFALDADRQVWVQPWTAPGGLPSGHVPVAAFEVLVGGGGTPRRPLELRIDSASLAEAAPAVGQLWSEAPGSSTLQPAFRVAWEAAGQAWLQLPALGRYLLSFEPGLAAELAHLYAPVLSLSVDDIHPIGFQELLASCQLRTPSGVAGSATPLTPTQLLEPANDLPDSRIELLDGSRQEFTERTSSWKHASLGGSEVASPKPPVVYWALRGAGQHLVLQYWFVYAASGQPYYGGLHNGYDLAHECDLEMAQVILSSTGSDFVPVAATASQHYYGEGRHWRDVTLEGGRLLLHVAEAGHATYFEPGFDGAADVHGSYAGETGFLGKVAPLLYVYDRCAIGSRQRKLAPGQYELRDLHAAADDSRALLRFRGRFGRDGFLAPATGSVATRGPEGFSMYAFPRSFHRAFLFSTDTSIRAIERNGTGRADRLRQGERMEALQAYTADRWEGPVQERIDGACSSEAGQPAHLAAHLVATAQRPEDYYACEDWRLVSITPATPAEAFVDQTLTVQIRWRGTRRRDGQAVQFPVAFWLQPANDENYLGLSAIPYGTGPSASVFFVACGGAGATADEGDLTVDLPLTWMSDAGVPPAACDTTNPPTFATPFHLWVRDASGEYLHLTCTTPGCQQLGPATGEPLRFVVRVCP